MPTSANVLKQTEYDPYTDTREWRHLTSTDFLLTTSVKGRQRSSRAHDEARNIHC